MRNGVADDSGRQAFKAILGYDVVPGADKEEYEEWLFNVHAVDLLANPHLDRLVFTKIVDTVAATSGNAASVDSSETFYRIAELHFAHEMAYRAYRQWFDEHPIAAERGPAGRTAFRFYVIGTATIVTRADFEGDPKRVGGAVYPADSGAGT